MLLGTWAAGQAPFSLVDGWEGGLRFIPGDLCSALSSGEASHLAKTACPGSPSPRPCLQVTLRLDTHPAMITVLEMGAARHFLRMQQLAKTQEERAQLLQPTLEINPR